MRAAGGLARSTSGDGDRLASGVPLARCGEHVVRIDGKHAAQTVAALAECELTSYDAAYVAAARRYDWTLVSTDVRDLASRGPAVAPDATGIQSPE